MLYVAVSYYSGKLVHIQVVIKYPYLIAPMCTREDMLNHNLGALYIDDVMGYNSLTTKAIMMIVWCDYNFTIWNPNRGPKLNTNIFAIQIVTI